MSFIEEVVPFGAGTPPALIVGLELYKGVSEAALPVLQGFTPAVALPVAVVGVAAMMAGEIYSYSTAFEALARKSWFSAAVSGAVAVACSLGVWYAVTHAEGGRAVMSTAVIVSVLIYAGAGAKRLMDIAAKIKEQAAREAKEKADADERKRKDDLALARANTRALEAQAKLSQTQAQVSESFQKVSESFDDWRKVPKEHKARIREACDSMSKAGAVAWIAKEYGKIDRTAANWYENAKEVSK